MKNLVRIFSLLLSLCLLPCHEAMAETVTDSTEIKNGNISGRIETIILGASDFRELIDWQINDCHTQNQLWLCPKIETFARNAEYFLPYTKGYSALGFFFDPTISYCTNFNLTATVGIHLMGIAGDEKKLREIAPIVRLIYTPAEWVTIIGGTLCCNGLQRGLYEPMYGHDRYFLEKNETGLEFIFRTKHWHANLWCNWEDFIEIGSDFQEKFTFGWVNKFRTNTIEDNHRNRHKFYFPLHLTANHRGGQFTSLKDTCIETIVNTAVGLGYSLDASDFYISVETPLFGFLNNSNEEHIHTHFNKGWGFYPQINVQTYNRKGHGWGATFGYWIGDGYISHKGSYLFQSRSYFNDDFTRKNRHMLTFNAFYGIRNNLGLNFQGYYDLDEKGFDFAIGLHLQFSRHFVLKDFNKKKKEEKFSH